MDTDGNPFAAAKARRSQGAEGGKPRHTIKFYLWQVLQESGEHGLTADELVEQLESRGMRSFAGNKKAPAQVSTACHQDSLSASTACSETDPPILHTRRKRSSAARNSTFCYDSATRRWTVQRHDAGFTAMHYPFGATYLIQLSLMQLDPCALQAKPCRGRGSSGSRNHCKKR